VCDRIRHEEKNTHDEHFRDEDEALDCCDAFVVHRRLRVLRTRRGGGAGEADSSVSVCGRRLPVQRCTSCFVSASHRCWRSNYLNVTQLAFKTCVHTFLHQELTGKGACSRLPRLPSPRSPSPPAEEKCITAVTRKYVGSNLRAVARLSELQLEAAKKLAAGV